MLTLSELLGVKNKTTSSRNWFGVFVYRSDWFLHFIVIREEVIAVHFYCINSKQQAVPPCTQVLSILMIMYVRSSHPPLCLTCPEAKSSAKKHAHNPLTLHLCPPTTYDLPSKWNNIMTHALACNTPNRFIVRARRHVTSVHNIMDSGEHGLITQQLL